MAKINVKKPFVLNLDGLHRSFGVGLQEVEDEVAEHWYVQSHSEPVDIGPPVKEKPAAVGKVGKLPPVRSRNQAAKEAK
jgi:hypothetical protein